MDDQLPKHFEVAVRASLNDAQDLYSPVIDVLFGMAERASARLHNVEHMRLRRAVADIKCRLRNTILAMNLCPGDDA